MDTYSEQVGALFDSPYTPNPPSDEGGRLRVLHADYTQDGIGSPVIGVFHLPAGRVRILGYLSHFYADLTAASVDLGWEAYEESDGTAVVADPNGLDSGAAVATLLTIGTALASKIQDKVFDSKGGVNIIATGADALADGDTFEGDLVYVLD